jgi:hypothetical protein
MFEKEGAEVVVIEGDYYKQTGVIDRTFHSVGKVTAEVTLDDSGEVVRFAIEDLVTTGARSSRSDAYLEAYHQSLTKTGPTELPPSIDQVYGRVSEKLSVHGRGTMDAQEVTDAMAEEGLEFWTNSMVNTVKPDSRRPRPADDELAYVYKDFGAVRGWHARLGGTTTIDKPCDTQQEAAFIVAVHLKSLGWEPPSPEALRTYKAGIASKQLLTEWRPSAQHELLQLELAPGNSSGYKLVCFRHKCPKFVASGKPYVSTLAGFPGSFPTGVAAAWYNAYCKKYKKKPPAF